MTGVNDLVEWLEADGVGGFASGTVTGQRTRRYHAVLLAATTPPTGRMVLVNGFDAWVTTSAGRVALSTQRYRPDVVHPDGYRRLVSFTSSPWPTWVFETDEGVRISHELVVRQGGGTLLSWKLLSGDSPIALDVRPFFSGRDYHALHHENGGFGFAPERRRNTLVWIPYSGLPPVHLATTGEYTHAPEWYRNFLYSTERERGLDDTEDLASPGLLSWSLTTGDEALVLLTAGVGSGIEEASLDVEKVAAGMRASERARRVAFATPEARAADAYLVRRGGGRSIVAGYPWFTDWGRDTFMALRGLCLATGRLAEARDILVEWTRAVSEGMLPNRFADAGETPEFNSVDASLWFVIAVRDLLAAAGDRSIVAADDRRRLHAAVESIVNGYAAGTRYGIRADEDGLLAAGQAGVQLTWMDARVGDRVITPRIGKPVEIQALWLNALWIAARKSPRWRPTFDTGLASFERRFWNADRGCLYDVVDVDHVTGTTDPTLRPNQILAVGGLPIAVLEGDRARRVVDLTERELLTPFGLRSLGRDEPGYAARYEGGPAERDSVYHQGTVWPWLIGPFVDAWLRVRGNTPSARATARERFVTPLLEHARTAGLGHVCEITDAEPPFHPRGCPFQAWSLGELIRADRLTAEGVTSYKSQVPSSEPS